MPAYAAAASCTAGASQAAATRRQPAGAMARAMAWRSAQLAGRPVVSALNPAASRLSKVVTHQMRHVHPPHAPVDQLLSGTQGRGAALVAAAAPVPGDFSIPAAPMLIPEGPWKQVEGCVCAPKGFKAQGERPGDVSRLWASRRAAAHRCSSTCTLHSWTNHPPLFPRHVRRPARQGHQGRPGPGYL